MTFSTRSYTKELLDGDQIPVDDLYQNLRELKMINDTLGGHAVTLSGMRALNLSKYRTYRILDIGSGGGDTLEAVARWGKKNGFTFELTGVDLKPECCAYATEACRQSGNITFIQDDYRRLIDSHNSFDIIITSLFCHHLNDEEIVSLFTWCRENCKTAFIMNDLHRHAFAYHSISILTAAFSKSYLVKNDAKLSVKRGFSRKELSRMAAGAGMNPVKLYWKWAFRWLMVYEAA